MTKSSFKTAVCLFAIGFTTVADAALISRLGGLAYYDDQLDITWSADADVIGHATWADANAWASSLTIGAVTGWRLPNMDVNADGNVVDCSTASMADCLDNELGFQVWQNNIMAVAPGPFSDVRGDDFYWSNTTDASDPMSAWIHLVNPAGLQAGVLKEEQYFAWAVQTGDVFGSAVPLPAATWLFGSGLLALVGAMRRRRR